MFADSRVWLGDEHAASIDAKRPWDLRCRYTDTILNRIATNSPFISCSLPVGRSKQNAGPWATGLLPEGSHLQALAARAKAPTNYTADLLGCYGRDIAGAYTITAGEPPEPRRWALERYTAGELAADLRNSATEPGFAIRDDSELLLAGLQNKLLVVRTGPNEWARPINGHPSTHIMKLDDPKRPGLTAAEHACLLIAKAVGLTTVNAEMIDVDGLAILVVDRYDRTVNDDGTLRRIHQEDACQALGTNLDAGRGRGKYQTAGGPSYAEIAELVRAHSARSKDELAELLRLAAFTSIIGNADGHGKNISFLIDTERGTITLAPAYDTVPTALWPELRNTQAMSVAGKFSVAASFDDLVTEGASWGLTRAEASDTVEQLAGAVADAVADLGHREDLVNLVAGRATDLLRDSKLNPCS